MSERTNTELSEDLLALLYVIQTNGLRATIQEAAKRLQALDSGEQTHGWAMQHWDGMIFSRGMFEDDLGDPATLIVYKREGNKDE